MFLIKKWLQKIYKQKDNSMNLSFGSNAGRRDEK